MSATDALLRGVRGLLGRRTMDPGAPPPGGFFVFQKPGDRKLYVRKDDGTTVCLESSGSGSGDVVGPSSSVASEVALFDGTTGKLLKRASGNGIAVLASGVLSLLSASGVLDTIGSSQGTLLFRGASGWSALTPGTAGKRLRSGGSGADLTWSDGPGAYGSGMDGAIDFDGSTTIVLDNRNGGTVSLVPTGNVYTLVQDLEATTIRVRSGVRVDTGGFIPYADGLVTFDDATAFFSRNGGAASGTSGGSGVSGGTLGSTSTGGGAGVSSLNDGSAPGGQTQSVGNRGAGGGNAGGRVGGGSGTRTVPSAANGSWRSLGFLLRGCRLHNAANWQLSTGGSGGGGGACNPGTGTASSGAGGGGGGVLVAYLRYVTGPGILEANGGAGSNATATGNGAAGGGGGGGGGYAALVTSSPSPSVTVRALGGASGTGAGGGNSGGTASAGNTVTVIL